MDNILKNTDCSHGKTYNQELVAKIMYTLLNMECEKPESKLHKLFTNKFTSIKDKFFTKEKFTDIKHWKLHSRSIYKLSKYNIMICSLIWGGSYRCPFKNKKSTEYDGYDFGNQDLILYNKNTHKYIVMNTFHIHAMYYHDYTGDKKFKIDLSEIEDILKDIPDFKMNISCKTELVYDNITGILINELSQIENIKPYALCVVNNIALSIWIIPATLFDKDSYEKLMKSGLIMYKKNGDIQFNKDFVYILPFDKNKKIDPKNMDANSIPSYNIELINKMIYEKLGIKLVTDHVHYKYNLLNKCYPIMKDIYYHTFE